MHTNAKSVTIPWFRVGYPEPDLPATIDAVSKALAAQQPTKPVKGRKAA